MTTKKKNIVLAIVMMFLLAIPVGIGFAKYITTISMNSTVVFTTELASSIELLESKAVRNDDGSYSLINEKVLNNTYEVMPGVDIPKDPKIIITSKSDVPSYLYIEVVNTTPSTITYSLIDKWTKLGIKGPNNGEVYVYNNSEVLTSINCPSNLSIIKDNILLVSDAFNTTSEFGLDIYAYMTQVVDSNNATTTFNNVYMSGGGD